MRLAAGTLPLPQPAGSNPPPCTHAHRLLSPWPAPSPSPSLWPPAGLTRRARPATARPSGPAPAPAAATWARRTRAPGRGRHGAGHAATARCAPGHPEPGGHQDPARRTPTCSARSRTAAPPGRAPSAGARSAGPVSLARARALVRQRHQGGGHAGSNLLSACDMPGLCVKATETLYTARPEGGPAYPEDAARASGNTFIYLTDPVSSPVDAVPGRRLGAHRRRAQRHQDRRGRVRLRGGRPALRSNRRQRSINKVVGICAGDPSSAPGEEPIFFTLMRGGVVAGQQATAAAQPAALPLAATPGLLPTLQRSTRSIPRPRPPAGGSASPPTARHLVLSHGGADAGRGREAHHHPRPTTSASRA